jgi:hypothetical protein
MRAYEVRAYDGEELLGRRFGASQANARTKRDELIAKFDIKKSATSTEEVEIPTDKANLLDFINGFMEEDDAVEEEE